MERYDGKSKKDDIRKYALIVAGVVLVIILYNVITWAIHKASHPTPDMTVVVACEKVVDFEVQNSMEDTLSAYIPDLDSNGKTVVEVLGLWMVENKAVKDNGLDKVGAKTDIAMLREYFEQGTYKLFLVSSTDPGMPESSALEESVLDGENQDGSDATGYCSAAYCRALPEDLADEKNPYRVELTGCKLFADAGWERVPFYGCIQKDATDEEYELAVEVLRKILAA